MVLAMKLFTRSCSPLESLFQDSQHVQPPTLSEFEAVPIRGTLHLNIFLLLKYICDNCIE